jgi:ribosomal-protein-alanine N-acetyltransferase
VSPEARVVLERAEPEDVPALARLEGRCHSHPWPEGHFRGALSEEGTRLLVLRDPRRRAAVDRGIEAYLCMQLVLDEVHVHNLAVRPDRRRLGLGRALLRLGLDLAARRGATSAFLEVRAGNEDALALYGAAGFEPLAVRRAYYAHPPEDALVLRRSGLEVAGTGGGKP